MRKKWTYVAVACMLLGTAPVFTGCIDTDEPAGLEESTGSGCFAAGPSQGGRSQCRKGAG